MIEGRYLGAILATVALTAGAARGELMIGQPAPPFAFTDWIKGGPIDQSKGVGKNVYLLEFWATWCPPCIASIPHLTELQRKYKEQGLIVIGVSGPGRGETLSKVMQFVTQRGDSMNYVVTYDGRSQTHQAYMGAAQVNGIPYSFLIDRNGRLAWHGHPGEPGVDGVIDSVVKGTYDLSEAKAAKERESRLAVVFGRLDRLARLGDWDSFKRELKEALTIDPGSEHVFGAVFYVYLQQTNDVDGLRTLLDAHIDAYRSDAKVMSVVARMLFAIQPFEARQPQLALRAAAAAYEASKGQSEEAVSVYARALFEIGMVDRAIVLQSQAVALADGPDRARLDKVLELYKQCKGLQAGLP